MRFDYPGIKVLDKVADEGRGAFSAGLGELEVTGSIVFVADDEAFSNMLWELAVARIRGSAKTAPRLAITREITVGRKRYSTTTIGTGMRDTSDYSCMI